MSHSQAVAVTIVSGVRKLAVQHAQYAVIKELDTSVKNGALVEWIKYLRKFSVPDLENAFHHFTAEGTEFPNPRDISRWIYNRQPSTQEAARKEDLRKKEAEHRRQLTPEGKKMQGLLGANMALLKKHDMENFKAAEIQDFNKLATDYAGDFKALFKEYTGTNQFDYQGYYLERVKLLVISYQRRNKETIEADLIPGLIEKVIAGEFNA